MLIGLLKTKINIKSIISGYKELKEMKYQWVDYPIAMGAKTKFITDMAF